MTSAKSITVARLRAAIGRIASGGTTAARETPRLGMPNDTLAASHERAWLLAEGLPAGCIHEIEGAGWDAEAGIAASSFAAALLARRSEDGAILWAVRDDAPFAPRLAAFGLDLGQVIFCRCRNDAEALAALEEALRTPGVAAAVGEVAHVTLTQSRRLHLICERAGGMGLILRRQFHGAQASRKPQGSAAATRWRIQSAPSATGEPGQSIIPKTCARAGGDGLPVFGKNDAPSKNPSRPSAGLPAPSGLGPPRWRLDLLYRRGGMPASFLVEWSDEARHLRLVAKLADHEAEPRQSRLRRAG
jgi:protein ImuA